MLSWNKQIDNICTKLARANGILLKSRHCVPKVISASVHFSLFYSHVLWSFGLVLLNSPYCKLTPQITKTVHSDLQKRCIRIYKNRAFGLLLTQNSGLLFPELKLLKVKDIFSLTKPLSCLILSMKN